MKVSKYEGKIKLNQEEFQLFRFLKRESKSEIEYIFDFRTVCDGKFFDYVCTINSNSNFKIHSILGTKQGNIQDLEIEEIPLKQIKMKGNLIGNHVHPFELEVTMKEIIWD